MVCADPADLRGLSLCKGVVYSPCVRDFTPDIEDQGMSSTGPKRKNRLLEEDVLQEIRCKAPFKPNPVTYFTAKTQ